MAAPAPSGSWMQRWAALLYSAPANEDKIAKVPPSPSVVPTGVDDKDLSRDFQTGEYRKRPRWISTLSEGQYWALLGAVAVGPLIGAVALRRVLSNFRTKKAISDAAVESKAYLQHVALFQPRYMHQLIPRLPPDGIRAMTALQFPLLADPKLFPRGIDQRDWRNSDEHKIQAALRRVEAMSHEELAAFHMLFTELSHQPEANHSVGATVRWVLTGQATMTDVQTGSLPLAVYLSLPPEVRAATPQKSITQILSAAVMRDLQENAEAPPIPAELPEDMRVLTFDRDGRRVPNEEDKDKDKQQGEQQKSAEAGAAAPSGADKGKEQENKPK